MAVRQEGSNIVVNSSVAGSIFPTSERDLVFPVLVDGSKTDIVVEGALYGRSIEIRGTVQIKGPVVARGDTKLNPGSGRIQLDSGYVSFGFFARACRRLDRNPLSAGLLWIFFVPPQMF